MPTVSEVMQAAQHAAGPAAKVSNRSREVEQDAELKVSVAFADGDTDRGPVKVRTAVLFDEPEIVVSYDKREVRFTVDRLDPASPRWVAAGPAGTTVFHGAGMSCAPSRRPACRWPPAARSRPSFPARGCGKPPLYGRVGVEPIRFSRGSPAVGAVLLFALAPDAVVTALARAGRRRRWISCWLHRNSQRRTGRRKAGSCIAR